jgi:hypothetical protein
MYKPPREKLCEGCNIKKFFFKTCELKNDGYEKRCPCKKCVVIPMCDESCHKLDRLKKERMRDLREVQYEMIKGIISK